MLPKRYRKTIVESWRERWRGRKIGLSEQSPFGHTEQGLSDYRGLPLEDAEFKSLTVIGSDFSFANFDDSIIEECTVRQCLFHRSVLTRLSIWKSEFEDCEFIKADMRASHIGFNGTHLLRCRFDGANVRRVGFINAVFRDIEFDAKTWNHTDFGASGFWNCSFSGQLQDIMFRGNYLLPSDQYKKPEHTGLHGVSFENATLRWVGLRNGCDLEDIKLPADGSAFICCAKDLIRFCVHVHFDSEEYSILSNYLDIKQADPASRLFRL